MFHEIVFMTQTTWFATLVVALFVIAGISACHHMTQLQMVNTQKQPKVKVALGKDVWNIFNCIIFLILSFCFLPFG